MKLSLASMAAMLLSGALLACASSHDGAKSSPRALADTPAITARTTVVPGPPPPPDSGGDRDNPTLSHYDGDDSIGRPASPGDRRAIVAVARRYYDLAAANAGPAACSLIYSVVAESIPEEYGGSSVSVHGRARTCGAVMTRLFRSHHSQLAYKPATLKVVKVFVGNVRAWILMTFRGPSERRLILHREGDAWRIMTPLDLGLP